MTDRLKTRKRNPAAVALGRIGGLASGPAKSAAASERNRRYWAEVRAGLRVRSGVRKVSREAICRAVGKKNNRPDNPAKGMK